MAFEESPPSSPDPPSSLSEDHNSHLQPFFVLHKALPRKSGKKVAGNTKRRTDLSPQEKVKQLDHYQTLRTQAFHIVWSKIDSSIKDVLRQINVDVFDKIHCWIRDSFNCSINSCGTRDLSQSTTSYPLLFPHVSTSKRLFTAFVFTKNMEFVDDVQIFADLALHLKSQGCLVANLSSSDFSAKNGIGGCLRSLLRQFLMVGIDAADLSILASWYSEHSNNENPVVVIIDDLERCCGPVLSDFIIMLSEWIVKVPVILIVGVATTLDALQNIVSLNALQRLLPSKFTVGSPAERMDAVVETVLVKCCAGFSIDHKVATFLRNYFLRQDGTLSSFIRAVKMAVVQHFLMEPLSLVLKLLIDVEETKETYAERIASFSETMIKEALEIQVHRNELTDINVWANGLLELYRLRKLWSSIAMCLYEAGKHCKVSLLDLYCEVLDPKPYKSSISNHQFESGQETSMSVKRNCLAGKNPSLHEGSFIRQAIRTVRNLPTVELCQLLNRWEQFTQDFREIHKEVKELQSLGTWEGNKRLRCESKDLSIGHTRSSISGEKDETRLNEKAAMLMSRMIRNYIQPIECIPFHEMVCFQKVDKLQSALLGDPRRRIQLDLLEFQKFLNCNCCSKNSSKLSLSMHDTLIMYALAQEHGDLINLHDWFQSFKAAISQSSMKAKRLKQLSSPKRKKDSNAHQNKSNASVHLKVSIFQMHDICSLAQFCQAIIELQLVGLLRTPSKRRPDYVQRVAFGL